MRLVILLPIRLIFITNPVVITHHVDFQYKSGWYYKSCSLLQIKIVHRSTPWSWGPQIQVKPADQLGGPFSGQVWLHGFDMPNFCPQQNLGGLCGSLFANFCHWLRARRGETLACKKSTKPSDFFRTNTIIVLDDCAALKELKSSTGQLVSLGFSARHVGITSISKPFCENMAAIALFYSLSDKTTKPSKIMPANLLPKRTRIWWLNWKNKIFLSGLCLALSLQNQNYYLIYSACLNRMQSTKSCKCWRPLQTARNPQIFLFCSPSTFQDNVQSKKSPPPRETEGMSIWFLA